jgi:hypothetical protein
MQVCGGRKAKSKLKLFFRTYLPGITLFVLVILAVAFTIPSSKTRQPAPPSHPSQLEIFLPGTPVGTVVTADPVNVCQECHESHYAPNDTAKADSIIVNIWPNWQGSMMAQAARDPIFYAQLAVSNNDRSSWAPGEYCIRCHSPMGWVIGHSEDYTGRSLVGTDLDGVQCDYCHRSGDPMNPDSLMSNSSVPVPGYGNGMHMLQAQTLPKRGPYDYPGPFTPPHNAVQSTFITTSNLCGICHDVSNPFRTLNQDRINLPPYAYAPLERTYSEWYMSAYATMGDAGSCQSCHMRDTSGHACVYNGAPYRTDIGRHDLTGGNAFVPKILPDFWPSLDTMLMDSGSSRAVQTLQRAAQLDVQSYKSGDSVLALVKITNLTGHKLPTGYPEGRRMWLNIIAKDKNGAIVYQSGAYDTSTGILTQDLHLKIYQIILGMTDSTAATLGVAAGPSFHFVVNDTILFDNRIPPMGFDTDAFRQRLAMPVGVTYVNGQYWDNTQYVLPVTATTVTVNLMYQTISRDYVKFLDSLTVGNTFDFNNWGHRLDSSWNIHGKSMPVVMNSVTLGVDSVLSVKPSRAPQQFALSQNYPNPFNPTTTIGYSIASVNHVTLEIYDVLGRKVATLVNETKPPGAYNVTWNATDIPSGIYFYRFKAGSFVSVKKLAVVK